jgi:hypothetical protein
MVHVTAKELEEESEPSEEEEEEEVVEVKSLQTRIDEDYAQALLRFINMKRQRAQVVYKKRPKHKSL